MPMVYLMFIIRPVPSTHFASTSTHDYTRVLAAVQRIADMVGRNAGTVIRGDVALSYCDSVACSGHRIATVVSV